MHENRVLAKQLEDAIRSNQFVLHYQPIVRMKTGSICGMEALLRWEHPEMGLIMPDRFIPQAESNGQIAALGEWVLHRVAQQALEWSHKGLSGLSISVNVSAEQLSEADYADRACTLMESLGMQNSSVSVALEITESQLIFDIDRSVAMVERLRASGLSVILDDFGTGYSSLSYLHRLPVDVIKIDKSFIEKIDTDHRAEEVVKAILALAGSLELETIVEGIERVEQHHKMKRMGCTYGQGFHYGHAQPAHEMERIWRSSGNPCQ